MEGVVEKFGGGGDDDMVFEVGWGDKDPMYFGEWSSERKVEVTVKAASWHGIKEGRKQANEER